MKPAIDREKFDFYTLSLAAKNRKIANLAHHYIYMSNMINRPIFHTDLNTILIFLNTMPTDYAGLKYKAMQQINDDYYDVWSKVKLIGAMIMDQMNYMTTCKATLFAPLPPLSCPLFECLKDVEQSPDSPSPTGGKQ